MDLLSYRDTALHRLDPRAKLLAVFFFLICILSFHKSQLSNLLPYFLFPVYLVSAGDIPPLYILKKVAVVSPFAFMVALFNPFYDCTVIAHLGQWAVTGGWVSFLSIMLRFVLTVGTVLALISVTGFYGICNAMERLKVPRGSWFSFYSSTAIYSFLQRRRHAWCAPGNFAPSVTGERTAFLRAHGRQPSAAFIDRARRIYRSWCPGDLTRDKAFRQAFLRAGKCSSCFSGQRFYPVRLWDIPHWQEIFS
jgi:hypothetical protein